MTNLVNKIKEYQALLGIIIAIAISLGYRVSTPQRQAAETNERIAELVEKVSQLEANQKQLQTESRMVRRFLCLQNSADQQVQLILDCASFSTGR